METPANENGSVKVKAEIRTKRFIVCPKCGHEKQVEHLMHSVGSKFGPWHCDGDCPASFRFTVCVDGSIDLTVDEEPRQLGWVLLKFRDVYLLIEEKYGRVENWDYFYHSHQCPTNLLGRTEDVYDGNGKDPHGLFRYVAGIDASEAVDKKIEEGMSLRELFDLFKTDGQPLDSEWPEANRGVIPWLAEMQRDYAKKGDA